MEAEFEKQIQGSQQDYRGRDVGGPGLPVLRALFADGACDRSRYETTFDTDGYGAEVEWNGKFTETSRAYVRVGAQQTEPEVGESDTNVIAGVGGSWNSPRNMLFFDFTRTVEPISAGTVVERYQLRMQIDHEVSPRVSLKLGARGSRDQEIADGTYPTRNYATADGGFEWRVQRNFAVTATYSYRWQEYADESSDRSSNGFLIGLVYEPKRLDRAEHANSNPSLPRADDEMPGIGDYSPSSASASVCCS